MVAFCPLSLGLGGLEQCSERELEPSASEGVCQPRATGLEQCRERKPEPCPYRPPHSEKFCKIRNKAASEWHKTAAVPRSWSDAARAVRDPAVGTTHLPACFSLGLWRGSFTDCAAAVFWPACRSKSRHAGQSVPLERWMPASRRFHSCFVALSHQPRQLRRGREAAQRTDRSVQHCVRISKVPRQTSAPALASPSSTTETFVVPKTSETIEAGS